MGCSSLFFLWLILGTHVGFGQAAPQFSVRFEQAAYTVTKVLPLQTNILIDPVPADKLFSYGLLAQVTSDSGAVGIVSVTPVANYNYNGPVGEGAVRNSQTGESGVRGTSNFFKQEFPALSDGVLAKLVLQPLPVGVYTLRLLPNSALGTTEQLFVTGGLRVSDAGITYGSSMLTVVNVAAEVAQLSIPRRNIQTGLFAHSIKLTNTTARTPNTLRIWIDNLPAGVSVANATGSSNGRSYIDYVKPLRPGASVTIQVLFRSANQRAIINPRYIVEEIVLAQSQVASASTRSAALPSAAAAAAVAGRMRKIAFETRPKMSVNRGQPVLEFPTETGVTYSVEYSTDLINWQAAQPSVVGTGAVARWTDSGPPRTPALPAKSAVRFYRVVPAPSSP